MIDLGLLRNEPDTLKKAINDKNAGNPAVVDQALALDAEYRATQTELQDHQTKSNSLSKDIGQLFRDGKRDEAEKLKAETGELKAAMKVLEDKAREQKETLSRLLLDIPNIPHPSVPIGATPEENEVVFQSPELPTFDFDALPHWELAQKHNLIDFERGAKVTGAGFPFYIGKGAKLQRALINFFLDLATTEGGYTEMQPPIFINADSATGTGQLPDKEDQMYEMTRDGFFALPTAEVPVTNYFRDEILETDHLPIKFAAYTPCFRREAGSYGKDVRGLNRLHQFDKVELVQWVSPDTSYDALESLREDAERPLNKLGLPYRRLLMCTGDLGFTQAKKYDLEVWSAGQERWLEVSSASNFEAYQARRTNIRYRKEGAKKPVFVHTLNGSGLALPRIVATLLENGQRKDGSIEIPEALQEYTGFDSIG